MAVHEKLEDQIKTKLSTLNETQDSIVSVANWIMFYRRHAGIIADSWLQRVRDANAPKRLNLLYLANEIVQQSKGRKKDDWEIAFSPCIVEGTVAAFQGAPHDLQERIRRVVEVWRQRNVFNQSILTQIESNIDQADKNKKRPMLGGSLGGSGIPADLAKLGQLHSDLSKASLGMSSVPSAHQEFKTLTDAGPKGALPRYSAQLAALLRTLQNAENAVQAGLEARKGIVSELSRLLETQQKKLADDEQDYATLKENHTKTEQIRRDVEDRIMRGETADGPEPERPEAEPLTPPLKPENTVPLESSTPPGEPPDLNIESSTLSPPAAPQPEIAGLASDPRLMKRPLSAEVDGPIKKRKSDDGGLPGLEGDVMDGIDPAVQEMLG